MYKVNKKYKQGKDYGWIKQHTRAELKKKRETDDFKKRSERCAKNKLSKGIKSRSVHTQGPISSKMIAKQIAKKTGKAPTPSEVFKATHKTKKKSWADERSKNTYEEFVARRAANPSKSDAEVFYEVVGGYQNGSVYGLGSSAPIYYDRPSSSRASKTESSYAPSIVTMLAGHLEQLSGQVSRLTQQLDARRSHDGQSQGTPSEVYRPDMNFGDTVVPDSQLEIPDLEQTCHGAAHNPFYFPHDPPPPRMMASTSFRYHLI